MSKSSGDSVYLPVVFSEDFFPYVLSSPDITDITDIKMLQCSRELYEINDKKEPVYYTYKINSFVLNQISFVIPLSNISWPILSLAEVLKIYLENSTEESRPLTLSIVERQLIIDGLFWSRCCTDISMHRQFNALF